MSLHRTERVPSWRPKLCAVLSLTLIAAPAEIRTGRLVGFRHPSTMCRNRLYDTDGSRVRVQNENEEEQREEEQAAADDDDHHRHGARTQARKNLSKCENYERNGSSHPKCAFVACNFQNAPQSRWTPRLSSCFSSWSSALPVSFYRLETVAAGANSQISNRWVAGAPVAEDIGT